uniref:Dynein axonemal assembly factor 4 n=1 Tax=Hippocampus comes TaxID=109280 RepID=A0A3Q2Z0C0_HIPCM
MPLLVTDHSWTQTESMVFISVPLKGAKKVDIVSSDEYLKVHFPPFLLEVFPSELVDDEQSSAKIGNGVAVISLTKRTNKLEEREIIQKMKDEERERTTAELEAWQLKESKKTEEEARLKLQSQSNQLSKVRAVKHKSESDGSGGSKVIFGEKKKQVDLPAPRVAGNIQVSFTPRVFPTALRESLEDWHPTPVSLCSPQWLKKQAEARRVVSADIEELNDLREEERNPDWLKEKGNKCFAAGNYLSALNAYNLAIRLNRKIPALYSNRAACHLKLRNFHKAIEDSSQALELLTPAISANAAARARAHVRRGSAFCQLELYAEGLQDYQTALKIDPSNEALQVDTQKIRDIIQGSAE